jgi:hypothetical protein
MRILLALAAGILVAADKPRAQSKGQDQIVAEIKQLRRYLA